MKLLKPTALVFALSLAAAASAQDGAQQRLREEMRDVLSRLAASGALDGAPLEVEAPPGQVLTLGLVLDAAPGRGPQVLAVTPGGNAERLGLRTGDRLLAVNGQSLLGGGAEAVRSQVLASGAGATTRFDLERGGAKLTLSGVMKTLDVPGFRLQVGGAGVAAGASRSIAAAVPAAGGNTPGGGCGRLSQFDSAPRSEKLYGIKIVEIDGHIPGPSNSPSYRVEAGHHMVTVAENIDYRQLPMVYSRARRQNSEKTFEVDVAPDTTLLLASKLIPTGEQGGADYWRPEVWKTVPESCR